MKIRNITEARAVELFDRKYGNRLLPRFSQLSEEFSELEEALIDYEENSGLIEHLKDETSDLYAVLTHFASILGLYHEELLEMAIDKVTERESNPDYKRFKKQNNNQK